MGSYLTTVPALHPASPNARKSHRSSAEAREFAQRVWTELFGEVEVQTWFVADDGGEHLISTAHTRYGLHPKDRPASARCTNNTEGVPEHLHRNHSLEHVQI